MTALVTLTEITLATGLVVFLLFRFFPIRLGWTLAVIGYIVFLASMLHDPLKLQDYSIFLQSGRCVLAGEDPYRESMALNTPQSMAFFAVAALLPENFTRPIFIGLFAIGPIALTWLSSFGSRMNASGAAIPSHVLGMIAALLGLSFSYRYGMNLGQLSVITSLGVLAAIVARRQRYRVVSGACMIIGSLKVTTMLPFLVLFRRKTDLPSWIAMIVIGFAITIAANPPRVLLDRCQSCIDLIRRQSDVGGVNSVTMENSSSVEIISLDRLVYCVGVRNRSWIQVTQLALLAIGTAALMYFVWLRPGMSEAAIVSIICVFAMLFLYHRIYDSVLLVFPLVWSSSRAVSARGAARWAAIGACGGIVSVWNLRLQMLRTMASVLGEPEGLAQRFLGATVLPYGIWTLVAVIVCLKVADHGYASLNPVGAAASNQ